MMPAYNHNPASCLFFVIYLCLELYLLMNLLLAVVYDAFSNQEKIKLKKLLLHRRDACRHAFKLLVSCQNPNKISLRHFYGLMKYYTPRKSHLDIYLTFKTLTPDGFLTLDQFYQIIEISHLRWKLHKSDSLWSQSFVPPLNILCKGIHTLVSNCYFDYFVYFVIAVNFVWVMVDTVLISANNVDTSLSPLTWYSVMFVSIYVLEAILKILGFGPADYFSKPWNRFDITITLSAVIGLFLQLVGTNFYSVVILRSLRLLRLFKLRKRLRDVMGTVSILIPQMLSLSVVMILLYFFFAVIGMELFAKYDDMRNCCKNTSVESYYYYNNETKTEGFYYLNNFNNVLKSSVTLFELTVVNNWYIIMEGYVSVSSDWSRLYFMIFYITTMVVLTVIVAIILEAFLFRIQYMNAMHVESMDDHAHQCFDVCINYEEKIICEKSMNTNELISKLTTYTQSRGAVTTTQSCSAPHQCSNDQWFKGERLMGKFDFGIKMYASEVETWIEDAEEESNGISSELYEMPPNTEES